VKTKQNFCCATAVKKPQDVKLVESFINHINLSNHLKYKICHKIW